MNLNPLCKRDEELWRANVPLIYYYVVEWHLPDRVLRQFGKLQHADVQHVATNQKLHKYGHKSEFFFINLSTFL